MNLDLFDDVYPAQPLPSFKLPNSPLYSYFRDESANATIIKIPNGELVYFESFFAKKISDRSIEYLLENINWQQDVIKLFGRETPVPRLSAWYGDDGKSYTYSGLTLQPNQWNKGLLYIKEKIEQAVNTPFSAFSSFNSVLLNWYRDGNDSVAWHSDAEEELGQNPTIASVSFGETRRFLLRRIDNHDEKIEISLNNGSLLIMRGEVQHFWQHSIPKQRNITQLRVNLTFREIKHCP